MPWRLDLRMCQLVAESPQLDPRIRFHVSNSHLKHYDWTEAIPIGVALLEVRLL